LKIGNLEVYGVIYKITNKVNGKVYIGQTTIGFDKRYSNNLNNTHNRHLKYAIKKYGLNSFVTNKCMDVAFSKIELDIKEQSYINIYDSTNKMYGYNSESGGSNGKPSVEARKLMSISQKERFKTCVVWNKGIPMTDEMKKRMSKIRKGVPSPRKGIPLYHKRGENHQSSKKIICLNTLETFVNMRVASRIYNIEYKNIYKCCIGERNACGEIDNIGMVWMYYDDFIRLSKDEIKEKLNNAKNYKTYKPIKIINLDTKKIFNTIRDGARYYNIDSSSLAKVCKGVLKTCGGYKWMYYDKYLKLHNLDITNKNIAI
jgi:group I intron endonuclease